MRLDPRITRLRMVELIKAQGENCTDRTLTSYASGRNWPHIRILKAISRATGVSLDELVFGGNAKTSTVREITDLLNRMESLKNSLQQGLGLGDAEVSPERLELLEAIGTLKPDQIKLLLDLTRGLRVK